MDNPAALSVIVPYPASCRKQHISLKGFSSTGRTNPPVPALIPLLSLYFFIQQTVILISRPADLSLRQRFFYRAVRLMDMDTALKPAFALIWGKLRVAVPQIFF